MNPDKLTAMRVPTALHFQSRFFSATSGFWKRLGNLETSILRNEIEQVEVRKPVYVAGLARSGTTILTEMLDKHPDFTSHRYSDFPNIWTPYWRNYLLRKTRKAKPVAAERAHQDRIEISNDSPEAVEEVLWRYFFPQCQASGESNVLNEKTINPDFEQFYHDHIRKLLLVRDRPRYLAKGNYNLSRFLYILKLYKDARLLIPYRNPVNHIASLIKQHELFRKAQSEDKRIDIQLALSGHFEFGVGRRATHFGDDRQYQAIMDAWSAGREVEGWALYWAGTYQFLLDQLGANPGLADASLLISYEDLCGRSEETIDRIVNHCGLDPGVFTNVKKHYCQHLSVPQYYQPNLSSEELETIERICKPVVAQFRL